MRYYIIAGEASGDLHASNLIKGLFKYDPEAEVRAWGGEMVEAAGADLVKHYKDLAIMGFVEVLSHLNTIRKNFKFAKADILDYQPDVLITVDFPGFNLRMVKWAKSNGIRTFHYISPNLWAWKKNRVYSMRKTINQLFVILPFETDFYLKYDVNPVYEGHPLLDAVNQFQALELPSFKQKHRLNNRPIVAILPGSRKQEISRMLPHMIRSAEKNPDYQYLIAGAPGMEIEFYEQFISNRENIHLLHNETYDILHHAVSGMICSGTATLEAALFNVPQVVCYKTNKITFFIARLIVKIRRFSLVNLILGRDAVKELIQHEMNDESLSKAFADICPGGAKHDVVLVDYEELKSKLGSDGVSDRLAKKMIEILHENHLST
ncbi:MAG: lipid-A-disaccharide synthase [Bacteroidales bacterium]|jgi:lipid-A-disaccharide synthase|nr:lipid-A-disaccharide synthase [Bacteroidales bacterium]